MTESDRLSIERVLRAAVTAVIERNLPIHIAVRAAAVSLLQAAPASAATPHAKHVEEGFAGGGTRIYRLLSRAQRHSSFLQLMDDVLQIPRMTGRVGRCA